MRALVEVLTVGMCAPLTLGVTRYACTYSGFDCRHARAADISVLDLQFMLWVPLGGTRYACTFRGADCRHANAARISVLHVQISHQTLILCIIQLCRIYFLPNLAKVRNNSIDVISITYHLRCLLHHSRGVVGTHYKSG